MNRMIQKLNAVKLVVVAVILLSAFLVQNANSQTLNSKKNFIKELTKQEGKGVLSGQFIRWSYNASLEEIETIHKQSNQWVAILGIDYYANFKDSIPAPGCNYYKVNEVVRSYFKTGGIVNISCHFNNPQNGGSAWNTEITFDSLFIEKSRVRQNYLSQLDCVAKGINDLLENGTVVIFRPLHEMNGDWFWWCGQKRYKELWQLTYHYLVHVKGITQLVWCYSPSASGDVIAYYPGNKYVDLVALDAYTSELNREALIPYKALIKLRKPFGFGEFGPYNGNAKVAADVKYDFKNFLTVLKNDFPKTVFFTTWRDHWGMANGIGVKELLNDNYIINKP